MPQATVIDGPRDQPNGLLRVEVLEQLEYGFFRCLVLSVVKSDGRTSRVGDIIKTHRNNIVVNAGGRGVMPML